MRLLLTSFLLLAGMARSFGMSIPAQEKVYLHFDQTGYFLKETMWFTAYVLNESTYSTKATDPQTSARCSTWNCSHRKEDR